jgi:hypothetical protein
MDHLDELRVATASSLPLNGLAPRTYARDHATFEALSNQRGLIADWLVDRLSSSRTAPLSVLTVGCGGGALDAGSRRLGAFAWRVFLLVCAGQAIFADGVRGCPCDMPPGCPRARTYSGQRRCREC